MSKKLVINVKSLDDAGKRFVAAWHAAKRGEAPSENVEFLTFVSSETLMKYIGDDAKKLHEFIEFDSIKCTK